MSPVVPTIYKPDYHPKMMIEYGLQGLSIAQCASKFGVSRMCIYKWKDQYPEFKEAVEISMTHAQAIEEEKLDKLSTGELEGSATAQVFKMKSRFRDDYQEVKQVNTTVNAIVHLPDDELNRQIAEKLKLLSPAEQAKMLPSLNNVIDGEFEEVKLKNEN